MEKLKNAYYSAVSFIKTFTCKHRCANAAIFGSGFFVGSQFTELFGAIFMVAAWMVGSFIGSKIYKNYKNK